MWASLGVRGADVLNIAPGATMDGCRVVEGLLVRGCAVGWARGGERLENTATREGVCAQYAPSYGGLGVDPATLRMGNEACVNQR